MTPKALEQYRQYKSKYPDYVLLFQTGNFYEAFDADAALLASLFGGGIDGRYLIPYYELEKTLKKIILAGHKVALCEQMAGEQKLSLRGEATKQRFELPPARKLCT